MEGITFPQLLGTIGVVLALIGAYNAIMQAVKIHRSEVEYRGMPVKNLSTRVDDVEKYLASDKRRIETLEAQFAEYLKQNKLMMKMQLALVRHSIDGNNIEDLKNMREEANQYLINQMGK